MFRTQDDSAGKKVKCPKCNQPFAIVPLTEAPVQPQPEDNDKAKAQAKVCEYCGQTIDTAEQPYAHKGKVVCGTCSRMLQTSSEDASLRERKKLTICILLIIAMAGLLLWLGYMIISVSNVRFKAYTLCLGEASQKVVICPTTQRVAIVQQKGRKERVVIDDIDGKEYDEIKGPYPYREMGLPELQEAWGSVFEFSPDGSRFAYTARHEDQEFLVINGKEVPVDGKISQFEFSPDGTRYAYVQRVDNRKNYLVVDGVKQPGNGDSYFYNLTFSPDSRRFAYSTRPYKARYYEDKEFVVIDGKELDVDGEKYRKIFWLRFLPATGKLVYAATRRGNVFLVVDGVKGSEYDGMFPPTVSPDGRRIWLLLENGDITAWWLLTVSRVTSSTRLKA